MTHRPDRRPAGIVDVVVIGAGHMGLAMSHVLSTRAIEHVVLERGEVANSWREERWDSLRLLTPNWMSRLPGFSYSGDDPDGYMSVHEVIRFVSEYAAHVKAPVVTHTKVVKVEAADGFRVSTTRGDWQCRAVVLASGAFNTPIVPRSADRAPAGVRQLTAQSYRNPDQLEDGGVLVVGASATGLQLAQEIHGSGRRVTLAVGEHVRMPRVYRGRDIQWWMHAAGMLDQRIEDMSEPDRARRVPSPQLIGTPNRVNLDLNTLQQQGVDVVGRLADFRNGTALFSGSLRNVCMLADLKMNRLLQAIDAWIDESGFAGEAAPPERYPATSVPTPSRLSLALGKDVRTVLWATGFWPDFSWLHLPVFDHRGGLHHDRGVTGVPGLYVLGLPFMRRRKSTFIHGAEDDVREIGAHLLNFLHRTSEQSVRCVSGQRTIPGTFKRSGT